MVSQLKVIKRDGRKIKFDKDRIKGALERAFLEIHGGITSEQELSLKTLTKKITNEISTRYANKDFIEIFEIQSIVEHELLESGELDVARAYIDYRVKKDIERQESTDVNMLLGKLTSKDKNVMNENANKDSRVYHTIRDLTAGSAAKAIGLKMLPPHVANAHQKGEIHYHDLDYHPYSPMTNCCLIDIKKMLKEGFKLGNAQIESPRSIQTAMTVASQIVMAVASGQYGGTSIDRIDIDLAPYAEINFMKHLKENYTLYQELASEKFVNKDFEKFYNVAKNLDLNDTEENITKELKEAGYAGYEKIVKLAKNQTSKDIYDSCQTLEFQCNSMTATSGQTPFFTVGFGLGTNWFEKEIQKSILKVRLEGLGAEKRTAVFPKLVYAIKRGVNLEKTDPNYDVKKLAIDCALKRMYPDILNYDKIVEITGSFKTPMGCRSFLQGWENSAGESITSGRMNLGVVTLNLPRLALESRNSKNRFWRMLEERLEIVKDALNYRIERCREANPTNAPILYQYGVFGERLPENGDVNELFKNGRATVSIGYIGLYEVATKFYGADWETNPEAKEFTLDILKFIKSKADEWKKETGYHYSPYGTPSESLTDRFCRLDKARFGKVKDITDKDYYTNSFHLDVRKKWNPFDKIDFEKDYPILASGGFIHYAEMAVNNNPKALEAIWDYAYDRIGYFGNNIPIDKCYECDFNGDFNATKDGYECPACNNTDPTRMEVVKRLCGYLGQLETRPPVTGRKIEIMSRVKHID